MNIFHSYESFEPTQNYESITKLLEMKLVLVRLEDIILPNYRWM